MKCVAPLSDPDIHPLTDMHRCHPSRRARMRAHGLLLSHQGFALRRYCGHLSGLALRRVGVDGALAPRRAGRRV